MSLCVAMAAGTLVLSASSFTLSWTHSVEKTGWEESWQSTENGLVLTQARIRGSGAGIDPPEGAVLDDGWWVFRPELPAQPRLLLAASGATGRGWTLCAAEACHTLGATAGQPVAISRCAGEDGSG